MDYAFCVLLCTQAERASFIGSVDALYLKTEAANKAQKEYTSWPEYTAAFLAGIQFTKGTDKAFRESMKDKEAFIVKLLASDHSPLQKVGWNTDLFVLKERNEESRLKIQ
ncbi:DUF1266 domain-containing protein [Domibacillus sp. A3M-37]|uniref:DUF1266 domain-containing protein n=1 Tax=Domibacillus sp. A3M-37 TaxID=2962037 RepID=UPI0020B70F25|nr:DUF1266 domain-containing protein [Domibacillus sp. A3M-37]MCP3762758.1 DUF1266 domain-containing protein [Domibacillus sp. A3M-37]